MQNMIYTTHSTLNRNLGYSEPRNKSVEVFNVTCHCGNRNDQLIERDWNTNESFDLIKNQTKIGRE